MLLRGIKSDDGPLLKELTLRSVEEAPYAFGGKHTFEEERNRSDAEWNQFAAEFGGDVELWRNRCIGYFILDGDKVCAKPRDYSPRQPKLGRALLPP